MAEPRQLPSPNAFDFYLEAARLLDDSLDTRPPLDPLPECDFAPLFCPSTPYTLREKKQLLIQNSAALDKLREGFKHEFMIPPDVLANDETTSPLFASRAFAKLLMIESSVRASRKDRSGAMESCLDAVKLGSDIPRGGLLIYALVGIAVEAIGRKQALKLVDRLDAPQARSAIARVQKIVANPVAFADVMREKKIYGRNDLAELLREPDWRERLLRRWPWDADEEEDEDEDDEEIAAEFEARRQHIQSLTKRGLLKSYERFTDEVIAWADTPYPDSRTGVPTTNDPIIEELTLFAGVSRFFCARRDTENAFLLTALALRAHKLDRGEYPVKLDELVPEYLDSLPTDPFSDRKPLRYERRRNTYLLYSIGPDCTDDGGRPIESEDFPPVAGGVITPDGKGDIVFAGAPPADPAPGTDNPTPKT